ncbi:MAG: hypothetical protein WD226_02075 [Planctomycetota bacterium]
MKRPLLLLALGACCGEEAPKSDATAPAVDPRVAALFADCGPDAVRFYDRNTSDPVAVLVEKLETGDSEVLRRTKEELGRLGARSVPALTRIIDRHFAEAMHAPRLKNALEALGLNPAPEARAALLRGLDHPAEIVQQAALDGLLLTHVRPEDFDVFLAHLATPVGPSARRKFALGLVAADPERARAQTAAWLRAGAGATFYPDLVPELAEARDPAVLDDALGAALPANLRAYPLAGAAAAGDGAALERVRELLIDPDEYVRSGAIDAAARAGLVEELLPVHDEEGVAALRAIMLAHMADAPVTVELGDKIDAALVTALDDPEPVVRAYALLRGVSRDLPEAVARALRFLDGDKQELQVALDAWRTRFEQRPEDPLVDKVRERLVARFERESKLPLLDRAGLLKGIGVMPGAESAQYLRRVGLELDELPLEGLRAHRWVLIQAANTGPRGLAWLAEELTNESDPARRLDLLQALGSSRDAGSRERLLALTESEGLSGTEILVLANALVHLGHTGEVATRLKRVLFELDPNDPARRALQCLLWRWF